jgi:hypothetical protein
MKVTMALQSINPFAGTDLEQPWQQGFAAAFFAPNADHTPPSPLPQEAQDAFSQGAIAGAGASGQLAVPPTNFDEAGDWGKMLEIGGHALVERGGFFVELIQKNLEGELTTAAIGKIALGGSISFFLFLVFSGALTGEDDSIEATAGAALRRVRAALASSQIADNLDLFMPVCDQQGHGLSATDEILKNGFWHGTIFLTFDQAVAEGRQHEHPATVRIVHFQTAAPDIVEVLDFQ